MRKRNDKNIERIIDANYNRAKEGLRVCEDICRFVLDNKNLTRKYKTIRHQATENITKLYGTKVIGARNIRGDVGKKSLSGESKRGGIADIFYANSQRVKESLRVLEEFAKLRHKGLAEELKKYRYSVYALEKETIKQC